MKELEEAIIFYESHLSKEIIKECKEEADNKKNCVIMLIKKYKENSNYNHGKLNVENREKFK